MLKQKDDVKQIKNFYHFVAGLTGSFISVTICHSLEITRTRLNLQKATSSGQKYKGFVDALQTIYREEGFLGYYKGYHATVLSVPIFFSFFFTIYNHNKNYFREQFNLNGFANHLVSSVTTGAICDFLTNPLWLVRTRLFTQYLHNQHQPKYTGVFQAFKLIYKEEGFLAFYKGISASFIGLSHAGIQFPVYERIKAYYQQFHDDGKLTSWDILKASIVSKATACILTYPHIVLRTRLFDNKANYKLNLTLKRVRIVDFIRQIYKKEGFFGFYSGLQVDLIRVLPLNSITFMVYEAFSTFFGERF